MHEERQVSFVVVQDKIDAQLTHFLAITQIIRTAAAV